jgi:hypothetical protein
MTGGCNAGGVGMIKGVMVSKLVNEAGWTCDTGGMCMSLAW